MNDEQGLSRVFSLVLLVATAMLGWISFKDSRELPGILGDRNTVTVPALEQSVTARLWEDPLQAVQVEVDSPNRPVRTAQPVRESIANRVSKDKKICLLLVPIPATPFPDDLEVRLRLRYSAQMALAQENFAPENRDALGYFQIRVDNALPSRDNSPAERNKAKDLNVPYEWFVPRQKSSNLDVLVLWLPEMYLGDDTLPRLAALVDHLAPLTNRTVNEKLVGLFVVGPRSSDTLKHMVPAYASPKIGHSGAQRKALHFLAPGHHARSPARIAGAIPVARRAQEPRRPVSFPVWGASRPIGRLAVLSQFHLAR
jgi:hypothetical protein